MGDGGKASKMAIEKSSTNKIKQTSMSSKTDKKEGKSKKSSKGEASLSSSTLSMATEASDSSRTEKPRNGKKTKKKSVSKKVPKKAKSDAKTRERKEKLQRIDDLSQELREAQAEIQTRKNELKSLLEKKLDKKKTKKNSKDSDSVTIGTTSTKERSASKLPSPKPAKKTSKKKASEEKLLSPIEKNKEWKTIDIGNTPRKHPSKKKGASKGDDAPPKEKETPKATKQKVEKKLKTERKEAAEPKYSFEMPLKEAGQPSSTVKKSGFSKAERESRKAPDSPKKSEDAKIGEEPKSPTNPSRNAATTFGSKFKVFEHQNSAPPSWAQARSSSVSPRPNAKNKVTVSRVRSSSAERRPTRNSLPALSTFGRKRSSPTGAGVKSPSNLTPTGTKNEDTLSPMFVPALPFQNSAKGQNMELRQSVPFVTPRRAKKRDVSQFASSKNALIEALVTPARQKKQLELDVQKTPRTLKRGFVALNIASPRARSTKSPTPPQRFMDKSQHERDKAGTFIDCAIAKLTDKNLAHEVESLIRKIESLNGFPKTRRLSMRDNELVAQLTMAVRNDPRVHEVHVDVGQFGTISSTLLSDFISSLRMNIHVKSLSFKGVELGNDFLYALAASMESNLSVQEIDLSRNCFTNEGLANFCQAIASNNDTLKSLNLKNQTTPISEASEVDVLEAFDQNTTLTDVQLDFMSDDGPQKLENILERNRNMDKAGTRRSIDDKLIAVLSDEAERAQELWDQREEEEHGNEGEEHDWHYLYELAVLFDKHKLKKEVEENAKAAFVPATQRKNADNLSKEEKKKFLFGEFQKNMADSVLAFNADGSFLTPEFITKYFVVPEDEVLIFDFHGQWKLFKRFPVHDPARQLIVDKFIDALVTHPRASEITGLNMANTGAGDDFLISLSTRCLSDQSLLPNLHTVNFETNFVNAPGVVALAKLVASPQSCKYMQVIRLENQKGLMKSKAEFALAKALRVNRSIVVVSLTIRNLLEKERIIKYVMRNVDLLRQARQNHMKATGTQRKRNKVELVFDGVKANDDDITEVNMMGNERFLTLTREERVKAASSFAHNSHVKSLVLNSCGIDDAFAVAFGEAIETNFALEKVHLEGNDISGEGIKALFRGLGKNSSIKELRLHKQSKLLASADEDTLADFLEDNTTITKLGIDLRSKMAQIKMDRKTAHNKNQELKEKAVAKGGDYVSHDSFAVLKF